MASLIVILAYLAVLALVLFPPKNLRPDDDDEEEESVPWWRNVRFWASVVVVAQVAVYAIWG